MKVPILLAFLAVASMANGAGYDGPTNQAGIDVIKYYEGWFPDFYLDPVGIRTIGYGHACHVWDCTVPLNGRYWVPLSLADGQSLLADDLVYGNYEGCVRTYNAFAGLNADMFSALVSFTFNLGCGNFQISALLEYLNAGNTLAASLELRKWINAGGQPLLGLARRRESERQLFCASGGCPTSCRARVVNALSLNCRKDPNLGAFIVAVYDEWVNLPVFERVVGDDVFGNPYWFLVGPGYVSAAYMEVTEGHGGWCSTTLASNATSNQV